MKKRFFLAAVFAIFLLALQAQTLTTAKKVNDIIFIGHSIHVFKMVAGYGYDVSYQNRLLIHQLINPITGKNTGLKTEEEAIKLAKWQIIHLGHPGVITPEERITSKDVANQLHIASN